MAIEQGVGSQEHCEHHSPAHNWQGFGAAPLLRPDNRRIFDREKGAPRRFAPINRIKLSINPPFSLLAVDFKAQFAMSKRKHDDVGEIDIAEFKKIFHQLSHHHVNTTAKGLTADEADVCYQSFLQS